MALEMGGKTFQAGERGVVRLPVTVGLDGTELSHTVHVIVGQRPGPTLALVSTLHGDEWQTVEVVRRVVEDLQPEEMSGSLIAVPVANPIALAGRVRTTRGSPDAPDLNQVFPGGPGWFTQLLARPLAEEFLPKADYLIDLHGRGWGTNVEQIHFYTDHPDLDINAKGIEMARAFGISLLHKADIMGSMPQPRNFFGYAMGALGIPSIMVEIGGLGYGREIEDVWINRGVQGVSNVMILLDILSGTMIRPKKVLEFPTILRIAISVAGYFEPAVDPEPLYREVKKGQVVGRVISPYTFEVLETLVSPVDGLVYLMSRGNMVHPGEWGFAALDLHDPDAEWITL
jgi:predicted deacylase